MFADEFNLVNEDADATGVCCNFAGGTAESWPMFLFWKANKEVVR